MGKNFKIASYLSGQVLPKGAREWELLLKDMRKYTDKKSNRAALRLAPCCGQILHSKGGSVKKDFGGHKAELINLKDTVYGNGYEGARKRLFEVLSESGFGIYPDLMFPFFDKECNGSFEIVKSIAKDRAYKPYDSTNYDQMHELKGKLNKDISKWVRNKSMNKKKTKF